MASIDFRRQDGGGNGRDGPMTDVVGGNMTIVGGISLNRDLSFGGLEILKFGGYFIKSGKLKEFRKLSNFIYF